MSASVTTRHIAGYSLRETPLRAPSATTIGRWLNWAPLAVILTAQAFLSGRLFHLGLASGDEARYIYAGHQLIHELWHGGGSPYYETYFSGAPVIYPILAALADHVGGYVAVRLMSLIFMLIATSMLFVITRRLWGYWGGVTAAILFAGLGLTQDLGALATYDAMSLMLMTVAAYFAVRTGPDEPYANWWLLAVPTTLFVANATKYATLLFDPIVIGLAAATVMSEGWRRVGQRIMALGFATSLLDVGGVLLGGRAYYDGIMFSTLNRKQGQSAVFATMVKNSAVASVHAIVADSWVWTGGIIVLAFVAMTAALLWRSERPYVPFLALLVTAGVLVTLEGIHLHSVESMRKHDDYGIWFTCIAAGYVPARAAPRLSGMFSGRASRRRARRLVIVGSLIVAVALGFNYSAGAPLTYEAGNRIQNVYTYDYIKPYLMLPHGKFLIGGLDNEQMIYADHLSVPWYRLYDDAYIKYPIPGRGGDSHAERQGPACQSLQPGCMYLEGAAGYEAAIRAHYFAVISLVGGHQDHLDSVIANTVRTAPGYVLLTEIGGSPTWIYAPDYPALG